jgi:hypothetical protein
MEVGLAFLVAGAIFIPTLFILMFVWWYIESSILRPLIVEDNYADLIIRTQFWSFWWALFTTLFTSFYIAASAVLSSFSALRTNARLIIGLSIIVGVALVWNVYHNVIMEAYMVVRQCAMRPILDFLVFPIFNIICMVYDTFIPFVNFYVNIQAFLYYGPFVIAFKCAASTDSIGNLIGYFTNFFRAFFFDFQAWLSGNEFMYAEWNILNSAFALGQFIDCVVPIANCFCQMLDFLFVYISFWFQLTSLHYALNCLWNVGVRLAQIPYVTVFYSPHKPNLQNLTLAACCTVINAGDLVEDTLYLIIEMLWGVITNSLIGVLPVQMHQFLSTHYTRVITRPACAVFRIVNMTNELLLHPTEFFASDGSGVGYVQFGFVFDEIRIAVVAFGGMFYIISNDIQATVTQILLSATDLVSFTVEWVIGNLFYFLYGGPALPYYPTEPYGFGSNFFRVYFPSYWLNPGTDVHLFFGDLFLTAEAIGSVIASIYIYFVPVGCAIEHILKLFITVVEILFNFFSFFYPIISFAQTYNTCFRAVNVDIFFNELYFTAGCLGDMFRQFDGNASCIYATDDSQRNLVCSIGNLIETGLDVVIIVQQQMVHFWQDMITLPTSLLFVCIFGLHSPVNDPRCLRIPDFTLALQQLNYAVCYFTDVVANILPITAILTIFTCQFPQPGPPQPNQPPEQPKSCNRITTCVSTFACNIIQFFLLPLSIVNAFFTKTLEGQYFSGFTDFLQYTCDLVFRQFGVIIQQFGLTLDCVLCAFTHGGTGCDDTIYQVFKQIADILVKLAQIFTGLFISLVKLFLTLIVGLFSGNPINAIVKFVIGFFVEVLGGLGTTVVNFLAALFDGIGLGFIGSFIKLLWKGFCFIIQSVMNIVIIALKAITFGILQINTVDFCCSGGNCTPSGGSRRRFNEDGTSVPYYYFENGTLHTDADSWLYATIHGANMSWPSPDECNQSMSALSLQNYTTLNRFDKGHITFCFMKAYWSIRTDNQTEMDPSKCDIMMDPLITTDWNELRPYEKATVMECMTDRLYVDAMRQALDIEWFPSDMLTNSYRKFFWAAEMGRGYLIYWQYWSDVESASAVILNENYQQKWANYDLNVSHYKGLNSSDDILIMRSRFKLQDYFEWNNAPQYEAVKYTTIGFWNFAQFVIASIENTTLAFSDNVTDPTIYLNYDYTLDSSLSGFTSSVNTFFHQLLGGAKELALYWSTPENVKKRSDASDKIKAGTSGMYDAAIRQLKLMTSEWVREQTKAYEVYTGQCDMTVNETIEFMYQYESAIHGVDPSKGEKSIAFKMYRWWQNINVTELFVAYPIANSRDPKYSCKSCKGYDPNYNHFDNSRVFKATGDRSFAARANEETRRKREVYYEKSRKRSDILEAALAATSPPTPIPTPPFPFNKDNLFPKSESERDVYGQRDIYEDHILDDATVTRRYNLFYEHFFKGTPESKGRLNTLWSLYASLKNQMYFEFLKYSFPEHEREMERMKGLKEEKAKYIKENGFDVQTQSMSQSFKQYEDDNEDLSRPVSSFYPNVDSFIESLKHSHNNPDLSQSNIIVARKTQAMNCYNPNHHSMDHVIYNVSLRDLKCTPYHDDSILPSNYYPASQTINNEGLRLYMNDIGDEDDYDKAVFASNPLHAIRRENGLYTTSREREGYNTLWADKMVYNEMNRDSVASFFDGGGGSNTEDYLTRPVRRASDILLHIEGFITLDCLSNISGLCQDCYYLDQAVGRVITAIQVLERYYSGGQYAASLNTSVAFFSYIFDENARVTVGDSPSNPLNFPSDTVSNWVYIGDDTPNKLYFNDVINRTNAIIAANSSLDYYNSSLYLAPIDTSTINGLVLYTYRKFLSPILQFFYNFFVVSSHASDSGEFFINWFLLCDWVNGTDFLGTNKRFSIGESMFMYLTGFFGIWFVVVWTVGLDLLSIVTGTSLSFLIFLYSWLSITYNWACLCWPGLPVQLMDDMRYFLMYTLLPKCEFFFAGIIITPYDNDHCYSCEIARNVQMMNCVYDGGFGDFISNVVFMLESYAPQILQDLRNNPTPLRIIYQIPYVNERLNQFYGISFVGLDYTRAMSCNFIYTLLSNLAIFAIALFLFGLFAVPLISAGLSIVILYVNLIYWMLVLMWNMLISYYMAIQLKASALSGNSNQLPTEKVNPFTNIDDDGGGSIGSGTSFSSSLLSNTMSLSSPTNKKDNFTILGSSSINTNENNDIILEPFNHQYHKNEDGGDDGEYFEMTSNNMSTRNTVSRTTRKDNGKYLMDLAIPKRRSLFSDRIKVTRNEKPTLTSAFSKIGQGFMSLLSPLDSEQSQYNKDK